MSRVDRSVAFSRDDPGFERLHQEPESDPIFAIFWPRWGDAVAQVGRGGPLPNSKRDPEMRWDAYVPVSDPDALADELRAGGVSFSAPLQDTHEGLRGFEVADPDGYVLFLERPKGR